MSVSSTPLPRPWTTVVAVVAILTAATGCSAVGLGGGDDDTAACGSTVLHVAAAPEIAPAVTEVAATLDGCSRVEVTPEDPATVARGAASAGGPAADVWIPDSSRWTGAVSSAGSGAAAPSIASSPVVLAVRAGLARGLGPRPTYDSLAMAGATTPTVAAADPRTSAATQAAMTDLRTSLGSTAELRGRLGAMLRDIEVRPTGLKDGPDGPDVQVATEQQVAAANAAGGRAAFVAVGPAEAGHDLDYPFVVTTYDPARADTAQALLAALTDTAGRARLRQLGFRVGRAHLHPLTTEEGDAAAAVLATLARPIRILAVVDVSGSMSRVVPGTGGETRLELARAALREGMRLFPDRTVAGLWRFSANLTPSADYEQVVPLTEITRRNRALVAAATDGLTVNPHGGTGLYATTLAAVRAVRAGYDPTRVNSVVVLSDGRDEKAAAHHVELETLVSTLAAETDPERPVIVNMIAYGPDSDAGAMQEVATATGGTVYAVRDPRQLPGVFRDALGNRLCTDAC